MSQLNELDVFNISNQGRLTEPFTIIEQKINMNQLLGKMHMILLENI